jgi:hypothetical protein
MKTVQQPLYEWKALPWRKIERSVFKLQKRIYQASLRDDGGANDKCQSCEEPDEGKLSHPFLKPGGRGDPAS